jgi:hypothetical protein
MWVSVPPGAVPGTHKSVAGAGVTYTPVRALRMAPGCCSVCTVYLPCGAELHSPPHQPPTPPPQCQQPDVNHALASHSGRPPCAQTDLYLVRARRGLGGSRTAHSYTLSHSAPPLCNQTHTLQTTSQNSTPPEPGAQDSGPTGPQDQDIYRLTGPDWEMSPYGCDVPL